MSDDLYRLSATATALRLGDEAEVVSIVLGDELGSFQLLNAVEHSPDGDTRHLLVALAAAETVLLPVPGLEAVAIGIVRDREDEWPMLLLELVDGPTERSVAIRHAPLRIIIANPYLLPVPPEPDGDGNSDGDGVLDGFAFEVAGSFEGRLVDGDVEVQATLESFSVPPFTIVGTGLVLALDDCRLVLREADVPDDIADFGFDDGFRGIMAETAELHWDLPIELATPAATLRGISLSLTEAAIGNDGLTGTGAAQWAVGHDGGDFIAADTELLGWALHPSWTFALAQVSASLLANRPTALGASGLVRVPFLERILRLNVAWTDEPDPDGGSGDEGDGGLETILVGMSQEGDEPIEIPLGPDGWVRLTGLAASGRARSDDHVTLTGSVETEVQLPGMVAATGRGQAQFDHDPTTDRIKLGLREVAVDGLPTLDRADLVLVWQSATEDGDRELTSFHLEAELSWEAVADQVQLGPLPAGLPAPPPSGRAAIVVRWAEDGTTHLAARFAIEDLEGLSQALLGFLPSAARPAIDAAALDIALTVQADDTMRGQLGIETRFRLPPGVAGFEDLVTIEPGGADEWTTVRFSIEVDDSGQPSGRVTAAVEDLATVRLGIPGLDLPRPPLELAVDQLAIDLAVSPTTPGPEAAPTADTTDGPSVEVTGGLTLGGDFTLRPILPTDLGGFVPSAVALHLERLLAVAHVEDLVGTATIELTDHGERTEASLIASFENAAVGLDLFDMVAGVAAAGQASLTAGGAGSTSASEIDLDLDIVLRLTQIELRIVDGGDTGDGDELAFGLMAELSGAGFTVPFGIRLAHDELTFGATEIRVPIALPELPMSNDDLAAIEDPGGRWSADRWSEIEDGIDRDLKAEGRKLTRAEEELALLEAADPSPANERAIHRLRFQQIPEHQRVIFHGVGKKFLVGAVMAMHDTLGELSTPEAQDAFQEWVELYQGWVDNTLGLIEFDTGLHFVVRDLRVVVPFNDPADLRVEGGAGLEGFDPDSVFAPLGDLVFKIALGAEAIWFSVEGGAGMVPLPSFGRYPGSGVVLDEITVGYGYSKNSLVVDVGGELHLSPELTDDADTSEHLGIGLRLPTANRLRFELDLIPVVLGEIDFLLPLIAFGIDLRSERRPPPPPPSGGLVPAWDGIQLIVPGALRADYQHYRFSPTFGLLPSAHAMVGANVEVGNEVVGFTYLSDDVQMVTPILGAVPIPFLADTSFFFDRLGISLRLAGFDVLADLARPFPSPHPLALFELFAFLSDPSLPIDPTGHLANLLWAEVTNARVTLPPAVAAMFPIPSGVVNRSHHYRVNLAVVLAIGEHLAGLVDRGVELLESGPRRFTDLLDDLTDRPPVADPGAVLAALPRDLRRLELEGSFVGFDASAVFLLVDPGELRRARQAPSDPDIGPSTTWATVDADDFSDRALPGWKPVGPSGQPHGWMVDGDILEQTVATGGRAPARPGAMLIREGGVPPDAGTATRVRARVLAPRTGGAGLVVGYRSDRGFLRFRFETEAGLWHLEAIDGTAVRVLHRTAAPSAREGWHDVVMTRHPGVDGGPTRVVVEVDREPWASVETEAWAAGTPVGLDAWRTTGAAFDDLRIEELATAPITTADRRTAAMARLDGPAGDAVTATDVPAWTTADLEGFGADDLDEVLPDLGGPAVVVAAQVTVLDTLTTRFLGVVGADGSFVLASTTDVDPLAVVVAGIEVALPFEASGRLVLDGRSAGADSWASVTVTGVATWDAVPGPSPDRPLARLRIGKTQDPVTLRIDRSGRFSLAGPTTAELFAGAVTVTGEVDLAHDHCHLNGSATVEPDLFVAGERILGLSLDLAGAIGPGRWFELRATGSMTLLGREVTALDAVIAPDGVRVAGRLRSGGSWTFGGFDFGAVDVALDGSVDYGDGPRASLQGTGRLEVLGAGIDGTVAIEAGQDGWSVAGGGRLDWLGANWVDGRIRIDDDGLHIEGQTAVRLDLAPVLLPGVTGLAGLGLGLTLSGWFRLTADGGLVGCGLEIDVSAEAGLPGYQPHQRFPILARRVVAQHGPSDGGGSDDVVLATLLDLDTIHLFPTGTVSVPTFVPGEATHLYVHHSMTVDPPDRSFTVYTPIDPLDGTPPAKQFLELKLWAVEVSVGEEFEAPIPHLRDEPPEDGDSLAITVPKLAPSSLDLSELTSIPLGLTVELVWRDGALGVRANGGPLVPLAPLGFGGIVTVNPIS